jgi:hypothetical protein
MTNRTEIPNARRLACSGCGTVFSCSISDTCWCMDESVRLPMPVAGKDGNQDCLCRDCLRKMAEQGVAAT